MKKALRAEIQQTGLFRYNITLQIEDDDYKYTLFLYGKYGTRQLISRYAQYRINRYNRKQEIEARRDSVRWEIEP